MLISLFAGIVSGRWILPAEISSLFAEADGALLGALMIFAGISLGSNRSALAAFKRCRPSVLMLPAGVVLGSALGGLLCGAVLKLPAAASLAISEGLCWYTLSAALVTDSLGAELGAIAFLSGLIREVCALVLIPFLSKKLGSWAAVGSAAATSGDVCLPVILSCCGDEAAPEAVANGIICTSLVPMLIPLLLKI